MNTNCIILIAVLSLTATARADPRKTTNYTITTDTANSGGARVTSPSYTNDGSLSDVSGISAAPSPSEMAKSGYMGQLYDVAAVQVAASPATMNEGATLQLGATAVLDDSTTLALLGTEVSWSVTKGPLTGINSHGLATAAQVYQDTTATAQGIYAGVTGTLDLSVINVGNDDFGIYAGDGIPDAWQVQYFGENNPLAAPTADADGTGQDNLFKYTAGLDPTDPTSRFVTTVATIPVALQHTITFSPRLAGRTYTLQYSHDLKTWNTFTGWSTLDNGQTRTVMDIDNRTARKFYRVLINQP